MARRGAAIMAGGARQGGVWSGVVGFGRRGLTMFLYRS